MTSVISYDNCPDIVDGGNRLLGHSAEELYLKRDYSQFFTGLIVGVLLTLIGMYWYKGGFTFPLPGPVAGDEQRDNGAKKTTQRGLLGTLRIRGSNVRMRACPGFSCEEIARLQPGTRVSDLGKTDFVDNEEWINVQAGSQEGWISKYYLE